MPDLDKWPLRIEIGYDETPALTCHAWLERTLVNGHVVREWCSHEISGSTLAELREALELHVRYARHVPPPDPWAWYWNGEGVSDGLGDY